MKIIETFEHEGYLIEIREELDDKNKISYEAYSGGKKMGVGGDINGTITPERKKAGNKNTANFEDSFYDFLDSTKPEIIIMGIKECIKEHSKENIKEMIENIEKESK